jgi:hypothetical protein
MKMMIMNMTGAGGWGWAGPGRDGRTDGTQGKTRQGKAIYPSGGGGEVRGMGRVACSAG